MRHGPIVRYPDACKEWLERRGYRLYTRQIGWWEVLVVAPGERWLGRGGTLEEALEDVLGQMLPSRVSREVLGGTSFSASDDTVGRPAPSWKIPEEPHPRDVQPASGNGEQKDVVPGLSEDALHPVRNRVPSIPSAPEARLPESSPPQGETEVLEDGSGPEPTTTPGEDFPGEHDEVGPHLLTDSRKPEEDQEVADTPEVRPGAEPEEQTRVETTVPEHPHEPLFPPPPDPLSAKRRPERRDTLSAMGLLRQEILDRRDEFGRLSPFRQRLCLTYWAARMRCLQGRHEGDSEVEGQAHAIARLLGELAAIHWPGTVPILSLQCTPAKALTILPKDRRPAVGRWEEVAEAMHSALRQDEEDDTVDEDGWGDERALDPRCDHPDEEFAGIFGQIGKRFPDDAALSRAPPNSLPSTLLATSQEQRRPIEQMVLSWARMARWLRQDVTDIARWGRLMGRLRWIAAHWPATSPQAKTFLKELEKALDERFCPMLPWARLLGRDASKKALRQARKELGRRLSNLDTSDEDALKAWFLDAVRVVDLTTLRTWLEGNELIRGALQDLLDRTPDLLQSLSKTQRRRARRLLDGTIDLLSDEKAQEQDSEDEEGEEESIEEPQVPSDGSRIPPAVLGFTRGKRAVFVGNRGEDPELHASLEEQMSFAELDFVDGTDPRRLDGLVERIAGGSYDMVLAATGFLSHRVDQRLVPACRSRGVAYFRVHRGRLGACVRAIARGIGAAGGS